MKYKDYKKMSKSLYALTLWDKASYIMKAYIYLQIRRWKESRDKDISKFYLNHNVVLSRAITTLWELEPEYWKNTKKSFGIIYRLRTETYKGNEEGSVDHVWYELSTFNRRTKQDEVFTKEDLLLCVDYLSDLTIESTLGREVMEELQRVVVKNMDTGFYDLLGKIQLHTVVPNSGRISHTPKAIGWVAINNFLTTASYVYDHNVSDSVILERLYKRTFVLFQDSKCMPTLPQWMK